jgi:hypothetical protein
MPTDNRPRLRLSPRQLTLTLFLLVVGNLWAFWLGPHVSNVDAPSAQPDGVISLRAVPENPQRPLIRRVVIGLAFSGVLLTGLAFQVLANYLEDARRLRIGLPPNAPEVRIFGKHTRARGDRAGDLASLRISRQVRPGVRVDLRSHLRPRMRMSRPS